MAQGQQPGRVSPEEIERVSVERTREDVGAGRAVLVCAYDDARCARVNLDGSITVHELEQRAASLPKAQEIVFYCA